MFRASSPPHLTTLIMLTGFSTLSLNMFLPSLASIADDLSTDYATVTIAVSGYLAVTALVQIVAGPLSDRIGRRPVLLMALVLFTVASSVCAVSQDIQTFLTFRMLQAGVISGYALSLAIVRDTTNERKAAGLIGYISMAMAIAPMLGPMLGGFLDAALGWRAPFYFLAVSGLFLFALCWVDLGETKPTRNRGDRTPEENIWVLVREPVFWAYSLCGTFATGAFYIFLTGAPLVATATFNLSTAEIGLYIGTITGGFILGSFISGKLSPKSEPGKMMIAGRLIACLGLFAGTLALASGYETPVFFFGSTVFVGFGNGITLPSSNAAVMSIRPQLAGSAAGLNGAMIVSGGAVLTSLTGRILTENTSVLMILMLMLMV